MTDRANSNVLMDVGAAAISAEKRLEGLRALFEGFAFIGESAAMERYRAEAHAALDDLLDAKATSAHLIVTNARSARK